MDRPAWSKRLKLGGMLQVHRTSCWAQSTVNAERFGDHVVVVAERREPRRYAGRSGPRSPRSRRAAALSVRAADPEDASGSRARLLLVPPYDPLGETVYGHVV